MARSTLNTPAVERLLGAIDWWVPQTLSLEQRRRARISVVILLLGILFSTSAIVLVPDLLEQPTVRRAVFAVVLSRLVLLFVLRIERLVTVVAHLIVATFVLLVAAVGLVGGGPSAPATVVVPLVPALATLLLSVRGGTLWTAIILTVTLALTFFDLSGVLALLGDATPRPDWATPLSEEGTWFRGATACITGFLGWTVAVLFEYDRLYRIKEMTEARAAAEEATAAKSRFLANMSHEIRTPMSGVVGIADLLAETELSEEQARLTSVLQSSSRSMVALLNDILDMSRIEANMLTLDPSAVELKPLIDGIVHAFSPQLESSTVTLHCHISPDTPAVIVTDELRLQQILSNLLSNAIKFTTEGRIELSLKPLEVSPSSVLLCVTVADSGMGMDAQTIERVQQPFQQADPSTTRKYGGSGLGLTICKYLTSALNGTLSIESAIGEGTTVTVTMRADIAETPTLPAAATLTPVRAQVLLVDDDAVSRRVARLLLEHLGAHVQEAVDGLAALNAATAAEHDLIFMDVHMPELDGLEVTRRLRHQGLTTPIVALTASAFAEDRQACMAAGMTDHLPKPIRRDQIALMLAKYVAQDERS